MKNNKITLDQAKDMLNGLPSYLVNKLLKEWESKGYIINNNYINKIGG